MSVSWLILKFDLVWVQELFFIMEAWFVLDYSIILMNENLLRQFWNSLFSKSKSCFSFNAIRIFRLSIHAIFEF